MKDRNDERLEQMLTSYCKADCGQSFVFDPKVNRGKVIPFFRFNRIIAAAASLVLVSVLSVIIYFSFGNIKDTPLAVKPSPSATPISPSGEGNSGSPEQNGAMPTEAPSALDRVMDILFPRSQGNGNARRAVLPTEKAPHPTGPSSSVQPSENGGQSATQPYQPQPTEPAPLPTVPCDPPSNDPTEPDHGAIEPTDEGSGSGDHPGTVGGPELPSEGDEPGLIIPTEGGSAVSAPQNVYASFSTGKLGGNGSVYCKVYDSSGRRLGSANLYDRSHDAAILSQDKNVTNVMYQASADLFDQSGYCVFVFYNSSGKMLAQVQQYVG